MTPEQLTALKNEITSDPLTLGYAGKEHDQIAKLINRPQRSVDVESIGAGTLVSCIDEVEYTALAAPKKNYLSLLVSAGQLDLNASLRQTLRDMFAQGSKTRTAILKAIRRDGSRAEELSLGRVTESDVADSLRS